MIFLRDASRKLASLLLVLGGIAYMFSAGMSSLTLAQEAGTAPVVDAGPDQQITVADLAFLHPVVGDDSLPGGFGSMQWTWSQVAGPAGVTIDHPDELITVARFPGTGVYTLRLTVSDGESVSADELVVTVLASHPNILRVPLDYPTIQSAIDAAQDYDLVLVSPGTYVENVTVTRTLTLASTYYTTGDLGMIDQTTIRSPDPSIDTVTTSSSTGPETQFIGFTVMDGNDGIQVRGQAKVIANRFKNALTGDGVEFGSGDSGYVFGNLMENNSDDGIDLIDSEVLVEGNIIRNNGGDGIEARLLNRTGTVGQSIFRGNDFIGNVSDGIQFIDNDTIAPTAVQFIIDRNRLVDNLQAAVGLMDNATSTEDYRAANLLERILVSNNTIVGNFYGITGGDNSVVVNNIIAGTTNTAVKEVDGDSTVTYNLFWNNGLDNQGSNLEAAHTLYADPLLDADYRPDETSPARDAGTAELVLPTGEQVLSIPPSAYTGSAPDLGWYEISNGSGNLRPSVNAGLDQAIALPTVSVSLQGEVSDDGLPDPPAQVTTSWGQVSGPPGVTFSESSSLTSLATFPGVGMYTLRLTASDGELFGNDELVVVVMEQASTYSIDVRVNASSDDAEESPAGDLSLGSSDLELVYSGGNQTVGLRFSGVTIPNGASISQAYVQFKADETQSEATALTIQGEDVDDAVPFVKTSGNISSRARTSAAVSWNPAPWTNVGEAGPEQQTPNIAALVQEIVDRSGWSSGNALAIIITGTGHRTAESFDGDPAGAPLLHVEYTLPQTSTPTATSTPTNTPTPVPPTATNTATPVPHTPTFTPLPPTVTDTPTGAPTASPTPEPPTPTNTPTSVPTLTATPEPPTATDTPVPPTATNTPVPTVSNTPPPPTPTSTPVPPTATNTPTSTPLSPTATFTPTATSGPAVPITFITEADSYVRENVSTKNFGSKDPLWMDASPNTQAYLRFTVTGSNGAVQSAVLRVYAGSGTVDGPAVYGVANTWTESGLTWANKPAFLSGPLDEAGAISSGTWVEYDVTAFVSGNGTYSFAFSTESTDGVSFISREGSQPAQLVVTGSSGPTATHTALPTATDTPLQPTVTDTPTDTPTASPTNTPTNTATTGPTPTVTNTPQSTATNTPTNTPLPTASFTATNTPTATFTPTATGAPGVSLTFIVEADSYVRENVSTKNFGDRNPLWMDASPNSEAYLRFTVTGLSGAVQSATLRVYAGSGTVDGPAVYGAANTWTESGLTWANKPAFLTGPLADVGAISRNTWIEYDVTAFVIGNGTYSFAFSTVSTDGVSFTSREGIQPAELMVTGF